MSAAPAPLRELTQQQAEPELRRANSAKLSDETSRIPVHDDIAILAYALWQQRGCPADSAERDWIEAEQQLRQVSQPRSATNLA
jgi:hypothetical protein